MKVLLVSAHPEERSLNASLRKVAITQLKADGHDVQVSDLYSSGWKAVVDRSDFPDLSNEDRLQISAASGAAYQSGKLTSDVKSEQEKMLWADILILQFPLWWFSMPAIMKGWVERVFSLGFAYGVGEYSATRYGDRYGDGPFVGKRAMLMVTMGAMEEHFSGRGINGPIDDVLFPINHGILYYPGFEVLPPFLVYRADRLDKTGFEAIAEKLKAKMKSITTASPIPYRRQNGGDYTMPTLQLKPGLEKGGNVGFALHRRE